MSKHQLEVGHLPIKHIKSIQSLLGDRAKMDTLLTSVRSMLQRRLRWRDETDSQRDIERIETVLSYIETKLNTNKGPKQSQKQRLYDYMDSRGMIL